MKAGFLVCAAIVAGMTSLAASTETGTNHLEWGSLTNGLQMGSRVEESSGLVQCWVRNGKTNEIWYNDYYLGIWGLTSLEIFDGGEWKCLRWPTIAGPLLSAGPSPSCNKLLQPLEIVRSRYGFTASNPTAPTFELFLSDLEWPASAIKSRSVRARAVQFLVPPLKTNRFAPTDTFCLRSPEFELNGSMIHRMLAAPEGLRWGTTTNGLQISARVQESGIVECWVRNGETNEIVYDNYVVGNPELARLEADDAGGWKRLPWSPTPATLRLPLNPMYAEKRRLRPFEVAKNRFNFLAPRGPQSPTALLFLADLEWPTNLLEQQTIRTRVVQELAPARKDGEGSHDAISIWSAEFELETAVVRKALAGPRLFSPTNRVAQPKASGKAGVTQ
jgi:hypothetical protein